MGRQLQRAQRQFDKGFTLLEVMIALGVIAIALSSIIKGTTSYIGNTAYIQERTIAHWVAMNKMAEFDVMGKWPSPGSKERGSSLMMGKEWYWLVETSNSDDFGAIKIGVATIKVGSEASVDSPISTLTGAYAK